MKRLIVNGTDNKEIEMTIQEVTIRGQLNENLRWRGGTEIGLDWNGIDENECDMVHGEPDALDLYIDSFNQDTVNE